MDTTRVAAVPARLTKLNPRDGDDPFEAKARPVLAGACVCGHDGEGPAAARCAGWVAPGRTAGDPVHVNDLHATVLRLLGPDHRKLTYPFQGRDQRLTDVGGDHDIADRLTG
jgi:hypothetical protein